MTIRRIRSASLVLAAVVGTGIFAGYSLRAPAAAHGLPSAPDGQTASEQGAGAPVAAGAVAGVHRVTTLTRSIGPPPSPTVVSGLGVTLAPTIRTCVGSRGHGTPTRSALCAAWAASGPVNVVIRSSVGDPYQLLMRGRSQWRPALGGWLVASGDVLAGTPGCAPGWRDSGQQVELRINRTERRHFKVISACTQGGSTVVFGEAHTDSFDPRPCGGDHMIDLDAARSALVAAFKALPAATVTVTYRQGHPSTETFPGGCGRSIGSDGRIADIVVGA